MILVDCFMYMNSYRLCSPNFLFFTFCSFLTSFTFSTWILFHSFFVIHILTSFLSKRIASAAWTRCDNELCCDTDTWIEPQTDTASVPPCLLCLWSGPLDLEHVRRWDGGRRSSFKRGQRWRREVCLWWLTSQEAQSLDGGVDSAAVPTVLTLSINSLLHEASPCCGWECSKNRTNYCSPKL